MKNKRGIILCPLVEDDFMVLSAMEYPGRNPEDYYPSQSLQPPQI
jgi:hypothetical protein